MYLTLEQKFQIARENHARGQHAEAEGGYRKILEKNPDHDGALYGLGVLEMRAKRFAAAADLLRRAAALRPDWADVFNALAFSLRSQGQIPEALESLERAASLAPDRPLFLNNYANALAGNSRFDEAIALFRRSMALQPGDPTAHVKLAECLHHAGRVDEAIAEYGQAIVMKKDYAGAYLGMGLALISQNRVEEALAVASRATQLAPRLAEAHGLRGGALALLGRRDEALAAYRDALRLEPNNPDFQFHIAGLTEDASVKTAPAPYVRALFDSYASTFDSQLVERLAYKMPEHLFDAVRAVEKRDDLDVLDLGCGTGLCGVLFRPVARRLVGVDLSPKMLRRAEARNIYDELIEADVTEICRREAMRWDIVLAADLFIYIGDLSEFFPAAREALRLGGLLAFSLEKFDGEGFHLHQGCRFAHSLRYVRDLAEGCSFEEVSVEDRAVRREGSGVVQGMCVVLRKLEKSPE